VLDHILRLRRALRHADDALIQPARSVPSPARPRPGTARHRGALDMLPARLRATTATSSQHWVPGRLVPCADL
jgi:DNA-binding helix-hairpin-helix protein with protein kinase domain